MTLLKQNRIIWDRSEPEDTGRKQTRRMSGAQAMEQAQGFTPELARELVATASSGLLGFTYGHARADGECHEVGRPGAVRVWALVRNRYFSPRLHSSFFPN